MIRLKEPACFGRALADLRNLHGLTQRQLAAQAGFGQSQVSHWEAGQREPDFSSVAKLAAAFGYDVALVPREEA
jgi:transcriptional regulator with XRE-family HTH domain